MTEVPIFNRAGEPIDSVGAWETLASPGPGRWADGYSAKALAEAWIDGRGPKALLDLVSGHGPGQFEGLRLERATAEAQTRFDQFGGPRNHDLLIEAADSRGRVAIGLEGKVNERFGETLDQYRAAGTQKQESGEATNAPARLKGLLTTLAGSDLETRPELGELGYQLFSATAGTLAAANEQGASRTVFVVHELKTAAADPQAQHENAENLADFVDMVLGLDRPSGDTWLVGPVHARQSTNRIPGEVDLWVGHLVTE
jgi:hypothetical protein